MEMGENTNQTAASVESASPPAAAAAEAPASAASEAPSGPPAATQSAPAESSASPAPWADSLAQRFSDEGVRGEVDAYLRDTIQPYVTQYEQSHGQASQLLDRLLGEDQDQSLETYLALTEAAFGPEVAMAQAQALVEQLQTQQGPGAQQQQTGTEVPTDELEQWLGDLPPQAQDYFRSQFETAEDQAWDKQLNEQIYPREASTRANDGALFSQYVAAADGDIESALQLWNAQMKPVVDAHPELFGIGQPAAENQNGNAQEAHPAAQAQAAADAANAAMDNGAPAVLGTTGNTGGTLPAGAQVPHADSLDEAVRLFFNDLHGVSADSSRGL